MRAKKAKFFEMRDDQKKSLSYGVCEKASVLRVCHLEKSDKKNKRTHQN